MTHNILEFVCVLCTKCSASNLSLWTESETREVFKDKRKRIMQAVCPELKWLTQRSFDKRECES